MRVAVKAAVLAVAFLAGAGWLAFWPKSAPPAVFATLTGAKPSLAEWHGKPVLIAFWATDCPTCLKEIPALKDLYGRYAGQGLRMVAVAMPHDVPSHVVSLANAFALPYAVALDPLGKNANLFGVDATPTTFLLDAEGYIVERIVGDFDPIGLAARIQTLLDRS